MSESTIETAPKKSFLDGLKPFLKRPVAVMIFLGVSSGLPLTLIFDTLSIWLRDEGLSLETIGFFSLATFSYSLKFVWAPVVDRVSLPILTPLLGHRRGWILTMQILIIFGLWLISGLSPQNSLSLMALMAVLIGFAGATQDIVIDAWRIETAGETSDGQSVMATAHAWGARTATFIAGIIPLWIADHIGWSFAYAAMAAMMGLGIVAVIFAPREAVHTIRPIDYLGLAPKPYFEAIEWALRLIIMAIAICLMGAGLTANITIFKAVFDILDPSHGLYDSISKLWTQKSTGIFLQLPAVIMGLTVMTLACLPIPKLSTRPGAYLRQTFVTPILDFFTRFENLAWLILAMICFYRVADFLLNINGAFYLDLGFEKTVIGEVRKIFGVIMTILGVSTAGIMLTRMGMKFSLIVGGIVGALSNLAYAWLATQGADVLAFSIALGIDNVSGGIAGTVLIAYMSSLISKHYAASQYALFSSLYAMPGKLIASQSGRIVESLAKDADHGGLGAMFMSYMKALPATAYAKPAQALGVTTHALASSYAVFFVYTSLIGLISVALAIWLIQKPQIEKAID